MTGEARPEPRTPGEVLAYEQGHRDARAAAEDLLGPIYLYIDWRYVTRQLTTEQKELFADAVENWSRRLDAHDPMTVDRWWRPDDSDEQRTEGDLTWP